MMGGLAATLAKYLHGPSILKGSVGLAGLTNTPV